VKLGDIGHGSCLSAVIQAAIRSAIMMVGRLVLAQGIAGMMDAAEHRCADAQRVRLRRGRKPDRTRQLGRPPASGQ
jgi:hypothetical protein